MGYDLHITRAESWAENQGHEISLEEWLRYVATDSEIQRDPENLPTDSFVYDASGFASTALVARR